MTGKSYYALLAYNGYGFIELARVEALGTLDLMRATMIDRYLYFLSADKLTITQIYN